MELTSNEPRMLAELDDFDELPVRRKAAQAQAMLHEEIAIPVRDFIPVTMPLTDLSHAIDLGGARSASEAARVRAEAHRPADVGHVLLRLHQRDDGVVALRRKLGGVAVFDAAD